MCVEIIGIMKEKHRELVSGQSKQKGGAGGAQAGAIGGGGAASQLHMPQGLPSYEDSGTPGSQQMYSLTSNGMANPNASAEKDFQGQHQQ